MQITLNQDEIIDVIKGFIRSQFNIDQGRNITAELRATRGDTGFTATLDVPSAKFSTAIFLGVDMASSTSTSVGSDAVEPDAVETPVEAAAEPAPTPAPTPAPAPFAKKTAEPKPEPKPVAVKSNPFAKPAAITATPEDRAPVEEESQPEAEAEVMTEADPVEDTVDTVEEETPAPAPTPAPARSIFSKVKAG